MSSEPRISGTVVTHQREHMRALVGREVFDRALGRLSPAEREEYLGATAMSWLPVALNESVILATAAESGTSWEVLLRETARKTQEQLLHTLHRMLMRITTDEALISRTPMFYARTYDTGKLASSFPGRGEAVVTLSEWPEVSDIQILGLGVGIETTLRCAGRAQAAAVWKRTREGATYHCTWKK